MENGLFSAKGRISRRTFWLRWLACFGINLTLAFILDAKRPQGIIGIGGLASLLLGIFIFIQAIKRMHDVNKNGWYALIPIYNIVLAFTDGSHGSNAYGDDPKGRLQTCATCATQNETDAVLCTQCGANLAIRPQTAAEAAQTKDALLLIYIVLQFVFGLVTQLCQRLDKEWYTGKTKYIIGVVWLLGSLSLVLLGLANHNKRYRVIGIVLTTIMAIFYIYQNINFMRF